MNFAIVAMTEKQINRTENSTLTDLVIAFLLLFLKYAEFL